MQRNKQKSSTEVLVDYSQCKFECIVSKKKLLGTTKRYLYIFDHHIIFNKQESKKKKPDRLMLVEFTKRVIWKYSDATHTGKRDLKGFTIDYIGKSLDYFGDVEILVKLKKHFARLFFQARVQDEYEAQCVIGQGNYAMVLELKHLHSDIKLASKCIDKKKLELVENGMKNVSNEVNIMRCLSPHQYMINLHEVYEGDTNIYLIMDLAEGGSLYQEMKHRKYLFSRIEIQEIMKYLLIALQYIHSKGVMHRDLKPENILYQTKGDYSTMKLADFGLSAFVDDFPYLYPKCGTPGFVAPEVANLVDKSKGYDPKCDVFSAGVIFHVLLFGEGLFTGKGHTDILRLNKKCEINPMNKKYDLIDQDAKDLLFKLIEVDPKERISTTQGLEHSFFYNEAALQYPQLLKESSTEIGEFKPVTPGTLSPFHNYMAEIDNDDSRHTAEHTNCPPPLQIREKQNSIITRTPLYKGQKPPQKEQQFSDFALDRDMICEEIIIEESKETEPQQLKKDRDRRHSLQINLQNQNGLNNK